MGKLTIASLVFHVVHRPFTKMIPNCAIQPPEGQKKRTVLHTLWIAFRPNKFFDVSLCIRQ